MDSKKLLVRSISGLVYAALIVVCILMGIDSVICLAGMFAVLATVEFAKICGEIERRNIPILILDMAGCITLCISCYFYPLLIWLAILIARMIEELYINSSHPLKNLAHSMMTQLYIGVPLGCMVAIADYFNSPNILLAVFFFIWINDTGAFLVGSTIGKHRLFERISPKKSWEGFFGGWIFNLITAALFCQFCADFFGLPAKLCLWLGLASIVTIFGTWGDLIESMLKRNLHIKDSGNIIPGHGGILDRIDSLLLVAPAVFLFLMTMAIAEVF